MARKSSDPSAAPGSNSHPIDREKAVFVVTSKPPFFERVQRESRGIPEDCPRFFQVEMLRDFLSRQTDPEPGFVLLIEPHGEEISLPDLRSLRLDFPQFGVVALLESCGQQTSHRLSSVGVLRIIRPPFDGVDVGAELASARPSEPTFKQHPDLMRRARARLDILIPSDLSYVLGINHEISLLLNEFGFPARDSRVSIPLVCDEAITNAIIHGNQSDPDKKVNIQIYVSYSRFRLRVCDQGEGFDIALVQDPTKGDNVMRSSGRGVYLMRNIMDVVSYKDGGRVLELEKRNESVDAEPQ